MKNMNEMIKRLVTYGIDQTLTAPEEEIYVTNLLLADLGMDEYEDPGEVPKITTPEELEEVLSACCDHAVENGIIKQDSVVTRDLFDTKLMNELLPRPHEVVKRFWEEYEKSAEAATEYYFHFAKASDYIRTYRVKRDLKWKASTEFGEMDITINLSKPEKDPKMIALAKTMKSSSYPKCLICRENEGYAGRLNHPARQNHRIIPLTVGAGKWGLQYSPYVYYHEHCIVFNGEHVPMKIDKATFEKLFDFIDLFPHYFIGSNADLPIVGGSILSHDHFQGGRYEFAMARAQIERELEFEGFKDVKAGIVKWPMSVIRLSGSDRSRVTALAAKILDCWRGYSDESVEIYAETEEEKHNTITPIARKRGENYELDLVLRNNRTTKEHPLGLFHPWEELHHIKKENIGLIEVMGLAVLPARLKKELGMLKEAILNHQDIGAIPQIAAHARWAEEFLARYDEINEQNIGEIIKKEVGKVFEQVLLCAGVFKRDEEGTAAFLRFAENVR